MMRALSLLAVTLTTVATALRVSTSARCGPDFGLTCKGSRFGDCCSQYSYCGSTDAYCGAGCQVGWGTCRCSPSPAKLSSTSTRRTSSTLCVSTRLVSSSQKPSLSATRSSTSVRCSSSRAVRSSSPNLRLSTSSTARATHLSLTSSATSHSTSSLLASRIQTRCTKSSSSNLRHLSSISSLSSSLALSTAQSSSVIPTPSSSETLSLSPSSSSILISSSNIPMASSRSSSSISSVTLPGATSIASSVTVSSETTSSVSDSATSDASILSPLSSTTVAASNSVSSFSSGTTTQSQQTISSTSSGSAIASSSDFASASLSSVSPSDTSIIAPSVSSIGLSSLLATSSDVVTSTIPPSVVSSDSATASDLETSSNALSSQGASTSAKSSADLSSTSIEFSATAAPPPTSHDASTFATSFTISESFSSSLSSSPAPDCRPKPSSTCNKIQDCPASTNAIVLPSATYNGIPVATATGAPYPNISVPINDLTVGIDYVLTFYGTQTSLLGAGSNSCCNLTAYMDDAIVSQYCVGYYWHFSYATNGPFSDSRFAWPRSPAVVFNPSTASPVLRFNVLCPVNNQGVSVSSVSMTAVSLVPRCTCQEEDAFESLQSQPLNPAFNGNFADYDLQQENPVSGWISQESWKAQVIPVQYAGATPAHDTSNDGSVILLGPTAALYRTISSLTPLAPYNVSIQWLVYTPTYSCNLTVKFNNEPVLEILTKTATTRSLTSRIRNSTIIYPNSTSGILWVGSICPRDFNATTRGNIYTSVRIDDVSFVRAGCDTTESVPAIGNSSIII